jgi:hypothetical protein
MSQRVDRALSVETAKDLFCMGSHPRAHSQLEGAVAIHNILERERVAYLADEVGLGKTYVALATLAMFRHFNPGFRALVIAPKANLQRKWHNDWRSFVRRNWLVSDLAVRSLSGDPAREVVRPERLSELAYEAMIDDDRDFICRLPSFSFAVAGDRDRVVRNVQKSLPWLRAQDFPRDDDRLRDFVAQAYNAALPHFDLVIIDEAHNLKGGIAVANGRIEPTALRNAVLAQVLGNPHVLPAHPTFHERYGPIADRVLLLSATPIETSFHSMWSQLHLVGKEAPAGRPDLSGLKSTDDAVAASTAGRILVRRINAMTVNEKKLTKNLYRRTWYQGGVRTHDQPLPHGSHRERLAVALVQKRVADEIGTRFNNNFQMGMLASFESFAETALARAGKGAAPDTPEMVESNFDGTEPTDTSAERLGVDTDVVNRLARSHFRKFGQELPHPKMDALAADLGAAWERGDKALVFVRRIASVHEIKRKLDERYNAWLFARLERDLPPDVWAQVHLLRPVFDEERSQSGRLPTTGTQGSVNDEDKGGADTFFSWFFRGEGPALLRSDESLTIESGASVARAISVATGGAANFFALHHLVELLDESPTDVPSRLAERFGFSLEQLSAELARRTRELLPASAGRGRRFEAVQYVALEMLSESDHSEARALLHALGPMPPSRSRHTGALDPLTELSTPTFFTRLRDFPELREAFTVRPDNVESTARKQAMAYSLLAAAARLGHSLLDLYTSFMAAAGARPLPPDSPTVSERAMTVFLEKLDRQRRTGDRTGAYWELSRMLDDDAFDVVRSLNLSESLVDSFTLREAPGYFGQRLGSQQPTVGMAGRVNQTAIHQFRMPGYPYVVVCTDVLQEGEDLHLFCNRVVHYGVAWTPSALEQRTGRIDRLNSLTERSFVRIDGQGRDPEGDEKIQVQVPYVPGTVEVLQSRRVFANMFRFVQLMHDGVVTGEKRLRIDEEILRSEWAPPDISVAVDSAFDVQRERDLGSRHRHPTVSKDQVRSWWSRLLAAVSDPGQAQLFAHFEADELMNVVYAWRPIGERVQPFTLRLASRGPLPLVQAMTPVGKVGAERLLDLHGLLHEVINRVVVAEGSDEREYDVSVEGDVILGDESVDAARLGALVDRITKSADAAEHALTGGDLTLDEVRRTMAGDVSGG